MAQKGYQNELIHEVAAWGYYDGAFHRENLRLGYYTTTQEEVSGVAAGVTSTLLSGAVVPAGQVWRVQAIAGIDVTNAPSFVELQVVSNTVAVVVAIEHAPVANAWFPWSGEIVLREDDYVRARLFGCTVGDDVRLRYHAIVVRVDL